MQKKAMAKQLQSRQHKVSVLTDKTLQTSILVKLAVGLKQVTQEMVVDHIHSIYFITKNEVVNHKFQSLQDLIDHVGHNKDMKKFGHDSLKSMYEFLVYIAKYLLHGYVKDTKAAGYWV